jgi:hypothetical protein
MPFDAAAQIVHLALHSRQVPETAGSPLPSSRAAGARAEARNSSLRREDPVAGGQALAAPCVAGSRRCHLPAVGRVGAVAVPAQEERLPEIFPESPRGRYAPCYQWRLPQQTDPEGES